LAQGATGSSETPPVTTNNNSSGGTPSGPFPKMVIVVETEMTETDAEIQVEIETTVETEMTVEDATPETPTKDPRNPNPNTIRIIRKKTDMMEMTIALTASAIPLNTHMTIPLNNHPHERR